MVTAPAISGQPRAAGTGVARAAGLAGTTSPALRTAGLAATGLALALAAGACRREGGVPDSELGELVIERPTKDHPIDVALAARDVSELGRAVATPHHKVAAALGPHRLVVRSRLLVTEPAQAGRVVEDLSDETRLFYASDKAWRGVLTNSADYGREVLFLAPELYLRARYQRWHQRPPNDEREPASLLDRFAEGPAANWDLLQPSVVVTDRGSATFAGRAARKLALSRSERPAKPAAEPVAQRKWRETRQIETVEGEVTLEEASGAVLALALRGTVRFQRDGRTFAMQLSVDSQLEELGQVPPLTPPAAEEVVQTPGRLHEVDERDQLLEGIAPPLRADRRPSRTKALAPKATP